MSNEQDDVQALPAAEEIRRGQASLRAAGDDLTRRILRFEEFLSRLPGRVEASYCMYSHDTEDRAREMLLLCKDGKGWSLYVYTSVVGPDGEPIAEEYRLLRDASIEVKAVAVGSFPGLLVTIRDAQKDLIKRARMACDDFDRFAAESGVGKAGQ